MKNLGFLLVTLTIVLLSPLADADLAQTTQEVKTATVHAAQKTGQVAKEVGHATASAAKQVGHSVANAARKGYQATKHAVQKAE